MVALATVLVVILVSLLIARVATVALTLTGLSREAARFQARSALSGTGFTTTEAETVVDHPVRRQVVMVLMLVGSAGLVTVVAGLMLSFADTGGRGVALRVGLLLGGLVALWLAARSSTVDRWLSRVIARGLRRFTNLEARDYAALLHVGDEYTVGELSVRPEHWVAGRTLRDLRLREEGVVVLGITRAGGAWLGAPTFATEVRTGDRLVLYGPSPSLAELDARTAGPEGDRAHAEAEARHREVLAAREPQRPREPA